MAALADLLPPATGGGGSSGGTGSVDVVRASVAALAVSALTSNATAEFFSPTVPAAAGPVASFCGPALSVSAATLPSGGSAAAGGSHWALQVGRAMPPCAGASTPGASAPPLTLPSAVVVSQPPPSVALAPTLLAELAASAPGASLSIVQWGVSPVPETAGTNVIAYKPLVKAGTLAAAADAAAAESDTAGGGAATLRRQLGLGTLFQSLTAFARGVFGGAPLRRDGATVAANAALRAAAPRPTVWSVSGSGSAPPPRAAATEMDTTRVSMGRLARRSYDTVGRGAAARSAAFAATVAPSRRSGAPPKTPRAKAVSD